MHLTRIDTLHLNQGGKALGQGLSASGRKTSRIQNKKLS
jgi:hypothetical protein